MTPLGIDTTSTWERLVSGEWKRAPLECIPVEGCRVGEGAEVVRSVIGAGCVVAAGAVIHDAVLLPALMGEDPERPRLKLQWRRGGLLHAKLIRADATGGDDS